RNRCRGSRRPWKGCPEAVFPSRGRRGSSSFPGGRTCLLASLASLALLGVHAAAVRPPTFSFLALNLLLAWVPYVAAVLLQEAGRRGRFTVAALLGLVWLLFLPNAPYMVSDLVHVEPS